MSNQRIEIGKFMTEVEMRDRGFAEAIANSLFYFDVFMKTNSMILILAKSMPPSESRSHLLSIVEWTHPSRFAQWCIENREFLGDEPVARMYLATRH
jgi:hypothetical protein